MTTIIQDLGTSTTPDSNTTISDGNSNYILTLYGSNDLIKMGNGFDQVYLWGYNDTIQLGNGNDYIEAHGYNETITAGNGNDTVLIDGGTDAVTAGTNTINLGNGNDTITIQGNSWNNNITAGNGSDTINITGSSHNNTINVGNGGVARDVLNITGSSNNDNITLGNGNNVLTLTGATHQDIVKVGNGQNIINISAAGINDVVTAGNGGNYINDAGTGNSVTSGNGNDTLVYNASDVLEDAGGGFNTLLVTSHQSNPIDLTPTKNFQFIDLTGNAGSDLTGYSNTLVLTPTIVDSLTGVATNPFNGLQKTLVVLAGNNDNILLDPSWHEVTPTNTTPIKAYENLLSPGGQSIVATPVTLSSYHVFTQGADTLIVNRFGLGAALQANPDSYDVTEASGQTYPLTYITGNVLTNDSHPGVATITAIPENVTLGDGNSLQLHGDGTFIYTINHAINGSDVFNYSIFGGGITSSPASITFNVHDTAPVANQIDDSIIRNLSATTMIVSDNVLFHDTLGGGSLFHVTQINGQNLNGGPLNITTAHGVLTVFDDVGNYQYTNNHAFTGVDSFTYTISDGLLTASNTINIHVTDNVTPVIASITGPSNEIIGSAGETWNITLDPSLSDEPFQVLIPVNMQPYFSVTENQANNQWLITQTAPLTSLGPVSFNVTATDTLSGNNSPPKTLSFNVDPGFVLSDSSFDFGSVEEGTTSDTHTETILLNSGDSVTLSALKGANANDFAITSNTLLSGQEIVTLTFTPSTVGNESASFDVTDLYGITRTVNLTGTGTDTAPVANDDTYSLTQNGFITSTTLGVPAINGVLANDTQGGGNPIQVIAVNGHNLVGGSVNVNTQQGNITVYSDGHFTYNDTNVPAGQDFITYTISDGYLTSSATANFIIHDAVTPIIIYFGGIPVGTNAAEVENTTGEAWQVDLGPTVFPENYSYSLLSSNPPALLSDFTIDPQTGLITQTGAITAQDAGGTLTLNVQVTDQDSGFSTTQAFKIDVIPAYIFDYLDTKPSHVNHGTLNPSLPISIINIEPDTSIDTLASDLNFIINNSGKYEFTLSQGPGGDEYGDATLSTLPSSTPTILSFGITDTNQSINTLPYNVGLFDGASGSGNLAYSNLLFGFGDGNVIAGDIVSGSIGSNDSSLPLSLSYAVNYIKMYETTNGAGNTLVGNIDSTGNGIEFDNGVITVTFGNNHISVTGPTSTDNDHLVGNILSNSDGVDLNVTLGASAGRDTFLNFGDNTLSVENGNGDTLVGNVEGHNGIHNSAGPFGGITFDSNSLIAGNGDNDVLVGNVYASGATSIAIDLNSQGPGNFSGVQGGNITFGSNTIQAGSGNGDLLVGNVYGENHGILIDHQSQHTHFTFDGNTLIAGSGDETLIGHVNSISVVSSSTPTFVFNSGDTFNFNAQALGNDIIKDFNVGASVASGPMDTLQFSHVVDSQGNSSMSLTDLENLVYVINDGSNGTKLQIYNSDQNASIHDGSTGLIGTIDLQLNQISTGLVTNLNGGVTFDGSHTLAHYDQNGLSHIHVVIV